MSSQDEFQTWALNEGYIDFRQEAGRYVNPTIRAMWIAWQASRAELVVELPADSTAKMSRFARVLVSYHQSVLASYRAALESAGITVKP